MKTKRSLNMIPQWALVLTATVISVCSSHALINPKYTPVHLVKDAKVILQIELGPLQKSGAMSAKVTTTLKGKAPAKLAFTVDPEEADLLENLTKARAGKDSVPALYFSGDSFEGAVDGGDGAKTPSSALCVGEMWFSLVSDGAEPLQLAEDALDLRAVWSGGRESLTSMVALLLADPETDVPVTGEVTWRDSSRIATNDVPVLGCLPVQLSGSKFPGVLLLSEKGDRYFQFSATDKKFEELTGKLKLESRSRFAAAADFDADRRVDFASSDGAKMSFMSMTEAGTLKASDAPAWSGECLGLAVCATATGCSGIIASTVGWPVLVSLGKDGAAGSEVVSTGEFAKAKWGRGRPCIVADFNNDGLEDIVQPCDNGILFYKGNAPGKWLAPIMGCAIKLGEGLIAASSGDFDADGLLDLVLAGDKSWHLLINRGGGLFSDATSGSGEANYSAQGKMTGVFNCDLNNDGREEFVFLRGSLAPTAFFNRGFACFGFCEELDFKNTAQLAAADPLSVGQSSGFAADLNGDGTQEVVMVSAKGEPWVLFCKSGDSGRVGLSVATPPGHAGTLRVTGRDGARDLGARVITPSTSAFFGKREKGPLELTWQYPKAAAQTKSVTVIEPIRFVVPPPAPAITPKL